MVLPGFCQKDCINGLSKEEAQAVKDIPTIEESIDGINSHITNMSSDIEDLQVASINFADHFDTLDGKVRNLESGVSDLNDEITEMETVTIPNISTQVNTLVNSTIPGINARLLTIEDTEIPDINSDISDINDAIDTINNRTIPDLQTDLDDGIQVVTDAISGLDDRIDALETGSKYNFIPDDVYFDDVRLTNSNRILRIRDYSLSTCDYYIPKGFSLTYLIDMIYRYAEIAGSPSRLRDRITKISSLDHVLPGNPCINFTVIYTIVHNTTPGDSYYSTTTSYPYFSRVSINDWNNNNVGCILLTDYAFE